MNVHAARTLVLTFMLSLATTSCGRSDDQRTDSVDALAAQQQRENWDPEMVVRLDSGNAAIRADSFATAQRHFLAVTEMAPDVAAGWFGLHLAERGLGRVDEAMQALQRAQDLAAGATLIHPTPEDTLR